MDFNSLNIQLQQFWDNIKLGKHTDMANQHGMLLMKHLKTDPNEFFKYLNKNKFTFKEFGKVSWGTFFRSTHLEDYLKPGYIEDALAVTTSRPAIGKGEFLFVSSYKNICFAKESGDLIDIDSGDKIEVKGMRSTISGDNKKYRVMTQKIMNTAFGTYIDECSALGIDSGDIKPYFDRDAAQLLMKCIQKSDNDFNKLTTLLVRLQNIGDDRESTRSGAVAQKFAKLYDESKKNLFEIVAAMQLYVYMAKTKFLLMVNNNGCCCFSGFENPENVLNMVSKNDGIRISTWSTGDKGMELSI